MAFQVFDGTLVGTCPPNGLGTFSASDRSKDDRKSCQEGIGARTTGVPHGKMEQWNTPSNSTSQPDISQNGKNKCSKSVRKCSIIEKWNNQKMSMRVIAKELGIGLATVSREIKRWNARSIPLSKMEYFSG